MAFEVQTTEIAFTEKQEALVKESWELLKHNIPQFSLRFFTLILEIAPDAKNLFSFLRDSEAILQDNPKLKSHAIKVFKMTCESAIQLREKGEVDVGDTTLKYLGSVHLKSGILDPHFEVVKEALLRTIKEGVGEKWTEELSGAWSQAYDHLAAAAIKAEMNKKLLPIQSSSFKTTKKFIVYFLKTICLGFAKVLFSIKKKVLRSNMMLKFVKCKNFISIKKCVS